MAAIKILTLQTVRFKREEKSKEEKGVIINYGDGMIIDMDGAIVPAPLWHWRPYSEMLVTVTADEDGI